MISANKAMKSKEMEALMNMSIDDLKKEQLNSGLIVTAEALATIGGAALSYAISGGSYYITIIPSPDSLNDYKTNNRVSKDEQNKIYENAKNDAIKTVVPVDETIYYIKV